MMGRPSAVIDHRHTSISYARNGILDSKNAGQQPFAMNSLNRFADPVYCIMRLIVGLMFACHGAQLVLGMFGGMPGSDKPMMVVGGWIQLVGGLLIALGLLTRVAAFIASGEMAVAYFMMHVANAPTPQAKLFPILNHGELATFYCWVFLFIFLYGPGRWSIDALMKRGSTTPVPSV
jgi:putative oxidoreductase